MSIMSAISRLFAIHSASNPYDSPTWERMSTIKANILNRWDTAVAGIRICCIKFVQRVVQVQTPGVIADPRVSDVLVAR